MTKKAARRGRPPHADDPPVFLGTTIPTSVDKLIREISATLGRPKSEILADAIRGYARRFPNIKHK
jgi:hypothetical protein